MKVDHLKILWCVAHVNVSKENRHKLDSDTRGCFFLHCDEES
jgi:hypothetical protein